MLPHPAAKRKIIILFSSEIFVKKISIAEFWPNMFHTAHICLFTLLFLFGLGSPSIWEPREGHAPYMSGLIVIPCFILDFSLPWGKADRKTLFNITINSPKAIMLQEKKKKYCPALWTVCGGNCRNCSGHLFALKYIIMQFSSILSAWGGIEEIMHRLTAQGLMEQSLFAQCTLGSAQKLLENRNTEISVDWGAEGTGGIPGA